MLANSISVIESVMKSVTEEAFVYATKACSLGKHLLMLLHFMQCYDNKA